MDYGKEEGRTIRSVDMMIGTARESEALPKIDMHKRFIITTLAIFAALSLQAQTGAWTGKLKVQGTELTLVFDLDKGTLDVPDQGAKDIPAQVSREATGTITIEIPSINASYKGLWLGRAITGTFTQHGVSFPLMLNPGRPAINRPQTPVGPFPYTTEDVSFTNGSARLSGTLTLPQDVTAETPALVMVTGSGLQNRDEELFGHKPFAVIADALARAGIATLRYDDRGFGESTGDVIYCTTEDLKDDALAGVTLLRERFERVGVLGHSEGGTIALMLAAQGQADFVISLAGMVVSGAQTLLEQNRRALTKAGVPESEADAYCSLLGKAFEAAAASEPLPTGEDAALSPALLQNYSAVCQQLKLPYLRYFASLDVSKRLAQVTCPVLALNGTKDTQVECSENLSALRSGLPANPHTSIRPVEGLNHLFQHCTTGETDEYGKIEETFSAEVLAEMISWINSMSPRAD